MATPNPTGNPFDPVAILEMASRVGFPLIFIVGQMREWWYVKPHVEMLTERLKEMATQLDTSEKHAERATDIAENAQDIARQALELSREIEDGIKRIDEQMTHVIALIERHTTAERDEWRERLP